MERQDSSLGILIKMMRAMLKVFKKRSCEQEENRLTIDELGLLHNINMKEEDVIQKDMANILGKDKSAILRLIDALEEKELVRRVVCTNDRRKNYLMVTKKGEKVIKQYLKIDFDLMVELQQGLTQTEIDTFYKVVNHIKSKAGKL